MQTERMSVSADLLGLSINEAREGKNVKHVYRTLWLWKRELAIRYGWSRVPAWLKNASLVGTDVKHVIARCVFMLTHLAAPPWGRFYWPARWATSRRPKKLPPTPGPCQKAWPHAAKGR